VGARFSAPVQLGPVAHPASYTLGTVSFSGVKRPGRGVDHTQYLAPRLKIRLSYTSTNSLGLRSLLYRDIYLISIITVVIAAEIGKRDVRTKVLRISVAIGKVQFWTYQRSGGSGCVCFIFVRQTVSSLV
jgi:hypothetical protein